jgi:CubicO group peptidase (beta-lactamase class C family)
MSPPAMCSLFSFYVYFLSTAAAAAAAAAAAVPLQTALDGIISSHTRYWNVSLSMAFGFDNAGAAPTVFAAARGVDDRFASDGAEITVASKIPSGSTDKAFTSAALLRCAELGLLSLDDPAHVHIDPWLARQDPPVPTLLAQWNGDATINSVTVRQLLSMRSGVQDYEDTALFEWTLAHPDADYLPEHFLSSVNKSFAFPPGQGGLYSGTGYVMLGMVLSAVQNASSWDKVDQLEPLLSRSAQDGGWKLELNHTRFMMAGKCSQYPGVTHQYIANKHPYMGNTRTSSDVFAAPAPAPAPAPSTCSGKTYPSTQLQGDPYASFAAGSAEACCSALQSKGAGPGTYWQYDGTNCTVFASVYNGGGKRGFTSGVLDGPFDPTSMSDLFDYSCLNGYTMGNIATTPTDVVKFYSALANGRIVSSKSLAEMQTYQALTAGYNPPPGTPYGLGLLTYPIEYPLKGTSSLSKNCQKYSEHCKCKLVVACKSRFQMWGHPGLDWASGMPFLGVISSLNMSFAMAFNSYHGFNKTMTYLENQNTYQYRNTQCLGFAAAVHHVWPDYPEFDCDQV